MKSTATNSAMLEERIQRATSRLLKSGIKPDQVAQMILEILKKNRDNKNFNYGNLFKDLNSLENDK